MHHLIFGIVNEVFKNKFLNINKIYFKHFEILKSSSKAVLAVRSDLKL